jgi:pimeloyl-ACP methyl ester carboxylesterase
LRGSATAGIPRSVNNPMRRRHLSRFVMVAVAALGLACATAERARPAAGILAWGSCPAIVAEISAGARCGRFEVAEDRDVASGRRISLSVTVLPATGAQREVDPVVILQGGPGDASSKRPREVAAQHAAINETRDLILVDQRGTGLSSPIQCDYGDPADLDSYVPFLPTAVIEGCITEYSSRADLTKYATRDFIADLEELRVALGLAQWNLHGVSYGTRVALQYMTRHPEVIRATVLHAPAPPELVMPVPFGEDAQRAFDLVVKDCEMDRACVAAFPRLRAEAETVVQRLERSSVRVMIRHPDLGVPAPVNFTRAAFGETVRAMLYQPEAARHLPIEIHEAFAGDLSALATRHIRRQRGFAADGSSGLYLGVTCAEDVARADEATVYKAHAGTILGDHRARQHFAACKLWPQSPRGDLVLATRRLATPVLILVGEGDPVTPPRWARVAAESLSRGRQVVVPQGGHGFSGMTGRGCLAGIQAAFFASAAVESLDVSCASEMRRLPFVLSR